MPERRFYDDWTARDWGEISNQDYANLVEVQAGMKSHGFSSLRLNARQEGNILHMHRVIDRYLRGLRLDLPHPSKVGSPARTGNHRPHTPGPRPLPAAWAS